MRSDEQLCEDDCNSGDNEPASKLVRRLMPAVRRIVFSMVVDHDIADDITLEIMIRAIGGLPNFNGKSKLSTWITRIALNTTYTYLEREKRRADQPLPSSPVDRAFSHSPIHVANQQGTADSLRRDTKHFDR